MMFGKKEWFVPKAPAESNKREKGQHFDGYPVDIAVFSDVKHHGDYDTSPQSTGSPDDLIPLANSGGCQFGLHELDERGAARLSKWHVVEPLSDAHKVNGGGRQHML